MSLLGILPSNIVQSAATVIANLRMTYDMLLHAVSETLFTDWLIIGNRTLFLYPVQKLQGRPSVHENTRYHLEIPDPTRRRTGQVPAEGSGYFHGPDGQPRLGRPGQSEICGSGWPIKDPTRTSPV